MREPYVGSEEIIGEFKPRSIGDAAQSLVETALNFHKIGDSCDSPIEEDLGAETLTLFASKGHPLKLCMILDVNDVSDDLLLVPQYKWSFYRSDWAILRARPNARALLIECDGKDFHSSTEQRAHDAKKDAAARLRGHITIRFTGSLIFRSPKHCAQKIFEAVGL